MNEKEKKLIKIFIFKKGKNIPTVLEKGNVKIYIYKKKRFLQVYENVIVEITEKNVEFYNEKCFSKKQFDAVNLCKKFLGYEEV